MDVPLQITFRHMEPLPSLEAQIRQRAEELAQFSDRITSCHVVVECRNPRHHHGNGHDPGANHAHEDAHVAVRDAFDSVRRQLEDHVRDRRGDRHVTDLN